jgi:hypothetical protein
MGVQDSKPAKSSRSGGLPAAASPKPGGGGSFLPQLIPPLSQHGPRLRRRRSHRDAGTRGRQLMEDAAVGSGWVAGARSEATI